MRALITCLALAIALIGCGDAPEPAAVETATPDGEWESAFVESNGVRIHYWRTGGEAKPVFIMAHGITDHGMNWASLAEKFENDYDIIMYDARGHGLSDKPENPYDIDTHVEDLVGLVKALGIEKPILMGHSMGGGTVAITAAKYPDLPGAVIMEDPAGMLVQPDTPPAQTEQFKAKWLEAIVADKALGMEKLIELARTERHPGWPDIEYERWAEAKMLVTPNVLNIMGGRGFGDMREEFGKITAPTLILKADADEENRQKHLDLSAQLPNGKLVHVDGAGHLIRLDKPAETEREIRTFLAGLNL
jgi:pimeloyl-ACP methyl ester carboxylesterase